MLDKIISEKWLTAKGVAQFWPCARHGDDVIIHPHDDELSVRLPFLRQQFIKSIINGINQNTKLSGDDNWTLVFLDNTEHVFEELRQLECLRHARTNHTVHLK